MDEYLKILDQALIVDAQAVALEWGHDGNNRTGEHELGHPGSSPLDASRPWSLSKCSVHNRSWTCTGTLHWYLTAYVQLLLAFQ